MMRNARLGSGTGSFEGTRLEIMMENDETEGHSDGFEGNNEFNMEECYPSEQSLLDASKTAELLANCKCKIMLNRPF